MQGSFFKSYGSRNAADLVCSECGEVQWKNSFNRCLDSSSMNQRAVCVCAIWHLCFDGWSRRFLSNKGSTNVRVRSVVRSSKRLKVEVDRDIF